MKLSPAKYEYILVFVLLTKGQVVIKIVIFLIFKKILHNTSLNAFLLYVLINI